MIRSKHLNTWMAALIALFMVLVLPSCWYGAMSRAAILGDVAPSSANSNEEREEHESDEQGEVQALGTRPPPPERSPARTASNRIAILATPTTKPSSEVSFAPVPHPAQFSVRRLR